MCVCVHKHKFYATYLCVYELQNVWSVTKISYDTSFSPYNRCCVVQCAPFLKQTLFFHSSGLFWLLFEREWPNDRRRDKWDNCFSLESKTGYANLASYIPTVHSGTVMIEKSWARRKDCGIKLVLFSTIVALLFCVSLFIQNLKFSKQLFCKKQQQQTQMFDNTKQSIAHNNTTCFNLRTCITLRCDDDKTLLHTTLYCVSVYIV